MYDRSTKRIISPLYRLRSFATGSAPPGQRGSGEISPTVCRSSPTVTGVLRSWRTISLAGLTSCTKTLCTTASASYLLGSRRVLGKLDIFVLEQV